MFLGIDKVMALLISYKYAVIFPIAVIEGPTISIIAGVLVGRGYFNLFLVYILIVAADLVGDTVYYCIGRYGSKYVIEQNRLFSIEPKKFEALEAAFVRHGAKLLFFGKLQGLGSIVLMSAGAVKYPFSAFLLYNTIATVFKSALLLLLGYFFYQQFAVVDTYVFQIGALLAVLFLVITYLYARTQFQTYEKNSNN